MLFGLCGYTTSESQRMLLVLFWCTLVLTANSAPSGPRIKRTDVEQSELNIQRLFKESPRSNDVINTGDKLPADPLGRKISEQSDDDMMATETLNKENQAQERNVPKARSNYRWAGMLGYGAMALLIFVAIVMWVRSTIRSSQQTQKESRRKHKKHKRSHGWESDGGATTGVERKKPKRRSRKTEESTEPPTRKSDATVSSTGVSERTLMRRQNRAKYLTKGSHKSSRHDATMSELETSYTEFTDSEDSMTTAGSATDKHNKYTFTSSHSSLTTPGRYPVPSNEVTTTPKDRTEELAPMRQGVSEVKNFQVPVEVIKPGGHRNKKLQKELPTESISVTMTSMSDEFDTLDSLGSKKDDDYTFRSNDHDSSILFQSKQYKPKEKMVEQMDDRLTSLDSYEKRRQVLEDIISYSCGKKKGPRGNVSHISALAPGAESDVNSEILFEAKRPQSAGKRLQSILRNSRSSLCSLTDEKPRSRKRVSFSQDLTRVRYITK